MCPNKPIPLRYEGRAGTVAKSDTRERSIYLNYITAMKRTDNLSTNGAQTPRTTGYEGRNRYCSIWLWQRIGLMNVNPIMLTPSREGSIYLLQPQHKWRTTGFEGKSICY